MNLYRLPPTKLCSVVFRSTIGTIWTKVVTLDVRISKEETAAIKTPNRANVDSMQIVDGSVYGVANPISKTKPSGRNRRRRLVGEPQIGGRRR